MICPKYIKTTIGGNNNIEMEKWQYLYLCAWCRPLNRLKGSHGICARHASEQFELIEQQKRELILRQTQVLGIMGYLLLVE